MQFSNLQKSDFWASLDKASGFVIINLLWVILALPLITLPAATAGLFAVHADGARGKDSEALTRFFSATRQYAWKASLLGLGTALGMGLVAANLILLPQMGLPFGFFVFSLGIVLLVGWAILCTNLYLWVLLPVYDLPLPDLILVAAQIAFQHVLWSTGLLLTATLLFALGIWILPKGGIVLVLFSGLAWVISRGSWRMIRLYEAQITQQTRMLTHE